MEASSEDESWGSVLAFLAFFPWATAAAAFVFFCFLFRFRAAALRWVADFFETMGGASPPRAAATARPAATARRWSGVCAATRSTWIVFSAG